MKLIVIGMGQCGSRIADEFARLNKKAISQRGIEICPGIFAVNTDTADLSGLTTIKADYQHRILIGGRKTGGHGVGKINELGAEIARSDADKIIDAVRSSKRFYEADGFLLIASSSGGTGSGSLPIIAQQMKERYSDKPIYTMVVLPFEHEETTEERTLYNTAVCLKSVGEVADAVFLIDNQRYVRKDVSLKNNISKINALIAAPFYDMLCAGEEKKAKYIGAKTLDAGDIIQTLSGWTTIGHGSSNVKLVTFPFERVTNFRKKSNETHKGIQAMDEAFSELSLKCNPKESGRALYLVSAPANEINMDTIKDLGEWMREVAPNAIIRNGDYPRDKGSLTVTVVLSELSEVQKIKDYYCQSTDLIPMIQKRQKEIRSKLKDIDEIGKDIPSLLD
jgi:cell division GTPase FtsZ